MTMTLNLPEAMRTWLESAKPEEINQLIALLEQQNAVHIHEKYQGMGSRERRNACRNDLGLLNTQINQSYMHGQALNHPELGAVLREHGFHQMTGVKFLQAVRGLDTDGEPPGEDELSEEQLTFLATILSENTFDDVEHAARAIRSSVKQANELRLSLMREAEPTIEPDEMTSLDTIETPAAEFEGPSIEESVVEEIPVAANTAGEMPKEETRTVRSEDGTSFHVSRKTDDNSITVSGISDEEFNMILDVVEQEAQYMSRKHDPDAPILKYHMGKAFVNVLRRGLINPFDGEQTRLHVHVKLEEIAKGQNALVTVGGQTYRGAEIASFIRENSTKETLVVANRRGDLEAVIHGEVDPTIRASIDTMDHPKCIFPGCERGDGLEPISAEDFLAHGHVAYACPTHRRKINDYPGNFGTLNLLGMAFWKDPFTGKIRTKIYAGPKDPIMQDLASMIGVDLSSGEVWRAFSATVDKLGRDFVSNPALADELTREFLGYELLDGMKEFME
ncbi:MAG: hypothetical protein Q3962_00335 [Corynebacterium sp.]|nr:hypothetical protein [Corynebacterium sp.]